MDKPTKEEVLRQIDLLREGLPTVKHYSMFGDDHHKAINAQIKVLEQNMDEDGIYQRWGDDERDAYLLDNALEAMHWRDGDGEAEESPWEGWQSLIG